MPTHKRKRRECTHDWQAIQEYTLWPEQQDDHKHLQAVGHPRLADTPFRSPQLTLFDLGRGDWLLYWKTPEDAPAPRRHRDPFIVQLPLFELPPLDMAVGADNLSRTYDT